METIPISKFKATCLAILDKVKRSGETIIVTRKGEPIAQIAPLSSPNRPQSWLGCFSATGTIVGDIVSPVEDASEWEALRQ